MSWRIAAGKSLFSILRVRHRTLCIPSANKRIECHGLGSRHSERREAESKNGTLGQAESNGGSAKPLGRSRVNRDQIELQSLEIVSEIFDVSCESFSDDLLELRCVVDAVMPVDRNICMRDPP